MSKVSLPVLPSRKGMRGKLRLPPDGEVWQYEIIDEIRRPQSDLPTKIFCIERLKFDNGRDEIRFCYYIIGKRPRMKGRWTWGQFAPLVPFKDFKILVREVEKRGWKA